MALTLARALLPLMAVTMVTVAAPLAEQAGGKEMAVAALGDSNAVDVAKRAKEEIVFGNQQNKVRLGAAKKSMEPEQQLLSQTQEIAQAAPAQLPATSEQDQAHEPEQPAGAENLAKDEANQPVSNQGSEQPKESAAESHGSEDKSAVPEDQPSSGEQESQPASQQSNPAESEDSEDTPQPADQQSSPEEAKEDVEEEEEEVENEPQPVPVEGGEHGTGEEEEEKDGEEAQLENNDVPLIPIQEGGILTSPEGSSESDGSDDTPPSSEPPAEEKTDQNLLPPDAGGDIPAPDSEAALEALDQPQPQDTEVDDVEGLLKDLHNGAQGEEVSSAGEGAGEEKVDDEGNAEKELMQVTNQAADGNSADSEYRQSLLKYILSHGDEYGRIPQANPILYSTDPYYLQRRRRSLAARSPFPHIHRRRQHNDEKALSRAKRTKRDLFDDNLYYNVDLPYDREQEEEEQEEAEKDEELQELITYLMALYPAVYSNDRPTAQFPAYLWQGPKYPEDEVDEEEEPYWGAEPPAYEEPAPAWEEPELQDLSPAWEPSFYPEELEEEEQEEEEPDFYPVAAKREMMSFVPGQRRKRYFFPFAREPYTHWGAFVPSQQKREYYEEEDPYQRLRELAMVLAEDRQQPSYFDTLDDYKKK